MRLSFGDKAQLKTGTRPAFEAKCQAFLCFNAASLRPPLFLVHPGLGEVLVFPNLAKVLEDDRPVYVLPTPVETFDVMMQWYIYSRCPNGLYYLSEYSVGACVAFEIGKALEKEGLCVAFLGILNLLPPLFRMELTWLEVLLNIGIFLSLFAESELDGIRGDIHATFPEAAFDYFSADPTDAIQSGCASLMHKLDLKPDFFSRWVRVGYEISHAGRTFVSKGGVEGVLTTAIPLPSMGMREELKSQRLSL
ncbi:hypothetical protein FISHEDRAFT_70290 [Fistulina hepatica ATCC 64428]|uniref:Thioesterase domain-containing protein n=1 Tax=Fistulina hepatica ATCC 64428 TaxID=1128425 RepID=A0A0D7AL76_9AGAR|nr:hypothetical protein FISHEDRAFT_70290 [Fistulina hepatica ATCC 64428]